MFRDRRVIALVPARGGSKGVPRKNLVPVGASSLLQRAIASARDSGAVDLVVVSTNDAEIAAAADRAGALVQKRSDHASTDESTAGDVMNEFVDWCREQNIVDESYVVYLQPTSPLRTAEHIAEAFRLLEQTVADTCVSVVRNEHTPFKALRISESGSMIPLFDETSVTANRQTLPETYRPNGAIYIFPLSHFVRDRQIPIAGAIPFIMSSESSVDIDTPFDIDLAEMYLKETE